MGSANGNKMERYYLHSNCIFLLILILHKPRYDRKKGKFELCIKLGVISTTQYLLNRGMQKSVEDTTWIFSIRYVCYVRNIS